MERIGDNIKRFYNCVSLYSLSCNVVIGYRTRGFDNAL